jgi:hypothetical protein
LRLNRVTNLEKFRSSDGSRSQELRSPARMMASFGKDARKRDRSVLKDDRGFGFSSPSAFSRCHCWENAVESPVALMVVLQTWYMVTTKMRELFLPLTRMKLHRPRPRGSDPASASRPVHSFATMHAVPPGRYRLVAWAGLLDVIRRWCLKWLRRIAWHGLSTACFLQGTLVSGRQVISIWYVAIFRAI